MCGIVGFVLRGGALPVQESERTLRLMADVVRHRGPDGEGYRVAGPAALGHRRLSIIDLATGAQPMLNEDGSVAIVFNGEIYNFLELRPKLEKAGHVFRTRSDTEVIIHAYEEYGTECLQLFNGMFAFALWDAKKQRLFAARDRMGKKPLYYAVRNDTLIFGSELTALLKHPLVRPIVTPYTVSRYLAFGYVPAPDTIYDQVYKLLPAQWLTFEKGNLNLETYWKLDFERRDFSGVPEAELRRQFWELFRDAVRLRLVSDVPLGVFLSGGIDSSAVVAMMCELMSPKDVKTFTIGFKERLYDESEPARAVARQFGTDHHEKVLDQALMLERLPSLIARMDEPLADSSMSPTSLVSEFARSKITVALGGDGGDELFAGYGTFWLDRLAAAYARLPRGIRRSVLEPAPRALFDAARLLRLRRAVEYIGGAADAPEPWRVMMWSEAAVPPAAQRGILASPNPEILQAETLYADTIRYEAQAPRRSRLARLQYQFQKQYLPDDILTKVDRASMMYGLEVRAPLLDVRIVDFANALPDRFKLRGRQGKGFLRRVLEGKLPDRILDRPKMGFGIPLAEWLRSGLRPYMDRALAPKFLEEQGVFRADALSRLLEEHLSGRRNHRGILWTVLALQLWWEEHKPSFRNSDRQTGEA